MVHVSAPILVFSVNNSPGGTIRLSGPLLRCRSAANARALGRTSCEQMALSHGERKFYRTESAFRLTDQPPDRQALIKYVHDSVIGQDATFSGPFGTRKGKYIKNRP